jgi:peptidyl-dipeptidase A
MARLGPFARIRWYARMVYKRGGENQAVQRIRSGIILAGFLLLCGFVACHRGGRTLSEEAFLRNYENTFQPLERAFGLLSWQASFSNDPTLSDKRAAAEKKISDFYADTDAFNRLRVLREKGQGSSLIQRQIEILYRLYLPYQVAQPLRELINSLETDLEREFHLTRVIVQGAELEIEQAYKRLLHSSVSEERQEYWEALLRSLRPLEQKFRQLVLLRNQAAQDLGFRDYFDMLLSINGANKGEFSTLLDDLESQSSLPFARMMSETAETLASLYGVPTDRIRPWHYPNPFFLNKSMAICSGMNDLFEVRDPIRIGLDFFKALSIDLTPVVQRSDLYGKTARESGAFRILVNRQYDYSLLLKPITRWEGPKDYDVRIVMNVAPDAASMSDVLHLMGHAAYFENIDNKLPYVLRQEASQDVSEGVAIFFGGLVTDPGWLASFLGASGVELLVHQADIRHCSIFEQLAYLRQKLCRLRFEQALYENPNQDLSALWRRMMERFQRLKTPPGWDNPDYLYDIDPLIDSPVYNRHFIYAFLLCAQIRHYLEAHCAQRYNGIDCFDWPAVGRFFTERLFSPGAKYPWTQLVEMATGEKLNPAYFLAQFANGHGPAS